MEITMKQKEIIEKEGIALKNGMTREQASEIIKNLNITVKQEYMLKKIGIIDADQLNRTEANEIIKDYSLIESAKPATEKQIKFLNEMDLEVPENLTKGDANIIIKTKIIEIQEDLKKPATEKQLELIEKFKIGLENVTQLTKGDANIIIKTKIDEIQAEIKKPATEKQLNLIKKMDLEVPENLTKGDASKLIYENIDKIKNYHEKMESIENTEPKPSNIPKNIKDPNPVREYRNQAKNFIENGESVSKDTDSKIIKNMIIAGYTAVQITKAVTTASPVLSNKPDKIKIIIEDIKKTSDIKRKTSLSK